MSSNIDTETAENFKPPEATGLAFAVGFYFSFRIVLELLSVRVLGTDPRTGAEITLALDLVLLLLVCFQSLGYANRTFGSMLRLSSMRWVLLFLVFSCCSLTWSGTVSLVTSTAYWCGMTADVAIVVLLLRAGSVTGVSHSLMKGFIASACCIALIAWIMPAQSDLRLGDAEFFNTNQIGNLCALAIFQAQYLMRRREGKWGLAVLLLALTLLRSLSKTTIVAFLLSESFLVIQDGSISRKTKMLLTASVILIIPIFWGLFEAYYDIYTTAGNQAETLTGRTAIWAYVLNAAFEQPWIGHGFDAMWKVVPPFGSDQFEARHAENELLQQFYAYGVAGICMLIGLYGSLYRQIRRLPRGPLKLVFRSIFFFVVIRGLAEAEPFDLLLPLWSIVLISLLVEQASTMDDHSTSASFSRQFDAPRAPQPLSIMG
ncbi:MAG TPA: O-antigen ligase family protein [Acidobacteriaceae bacterium]|jgi:O-antigen ligase